MKVLVTGATGFLGRVLVKRLESLYMQVDICNSEIANLSEYKNLDIFNGLEFDMIFHLATNTKAGDWCVHNSGVQWITNQEINTNILKFWSEKQPQAKLIAMGTSCSYDPNFPLKEEFYEQGTPEENLYYYAHTKRMLLIGMRALGKQYGLDWLYVIPSTLYGPGYDKEDNHFIFDLVRKIYNGKIKGTSVELWGDGYQKRELIYVDDFVELLLNVVMINREVINIGRGYEDSIRNYSAIISDILGYTGTIVYNIDRFTGVRSKCLDITKLRKYVSDFKYLPILAGLRSLIDWEESQNDTKISTDISRTN